MCGILFFYGPNAAHHVSERLSNLKHRGPDDQGVWTYHDMALGFTRLAINGDLNEGHQPLEHENLIGAINGEIYNHRTLSERFELPQHNCDARILLPLYTKLGANIINVIDGFYAAVIVDPEQHKVICLRDQMGKKPLFVGQSNGSLLITSELKAIQSCQWFEWLPKGASCVDLKTGQVTQLMAHQQITPNSNDLCTLFERAILKRVPDQPMGVFLSGGLDSSIVAAHTSRIAQEATYFVLGDGPDRQAAEDVIEHLQLKHICYVELPEDIEPLIHQVIYSTESYNPSIISNGIATYLLAQRAQMENIKVVLTGEGADELFGGYHHFKKQDPWQHTRDQLIDQMHYTELRRLDLSCMAHGVEPRCPFLDRDILAYSHTLGFEQLYTQRQNKVTLRQYFGDLLPDSIINRLKTSFDVGSGIRARVVKHLKTIHASERMSLKEIWKTYFSHDVSHPYFSAYPTFDEVIDRRGVKHR